MRPCARSQLHFPFFIFHFSFFISHYSVNPAAVIVVGYAEAR
jgi:hypothetical protein